MPRTLEKTVFTFEELSESAKKYALEKWSEMISGDEIHEPIYEDAQQAFALCGFSNLEICYSGFSFQGDGASFEGNWAASDVKPGELKSYAPDDGELGAIDDALAMLIARYPSMTATIKRSDNHSCHEYSVNVDVEVYDVDNDPINGVEFDSPEYKLMEAAGTRASEEFTEIARRCMRWIYKQLEKEYEYQNSEETMSENIIANEMEFDEEGILQ